MVYGRQYCSSSVILMDYYSVFSLLLLCLSPLLVCHFYLHMLLLLLPSVSGSFLGLLLVLFFCFCCGLRCRVNSGIPIVLWLNFVLSTSPYSYVPDHAFPHYVFLLCILVFLEVVSIHFYCFVFSWLFSSLCLVRDLQFFNSNSKPLT